MIVVDRYSVIKLGHNPAPDKVKAIRFNPRPYGKDSLSTYDAPSHAGFLEALSDVGFVMPIKA